MIFILHKRNGKIQVGNLFKSKIIVSTSKNASAWWLPNLTAIDRVSEYTNKLLIWNGRLLV